MWGDLNKGNSDGEWVNGDLQLFVEKRHHTTGKHFGVDIERGCMHTFSFI